jgi:uncharacterized DUF497 family protein
VKISYDPAKRVATLERRGVDFEDAIEVFTGVTLDFADDRADYGEDRIITFGRLRGRVMVVVWTQRDAVRHVISMRKANEREQARFGQRFAED